jgi:hypothetical protein
MASSHELDLPFGRWWNRQLAGEYHDENLFPEGFDRQRAGWCRISLSGDRISGFAGIVPQGVLGFGIVVAAATARSGCSQCLNISHSQWIFA